MVALASDNALPFWNALTAYLAESVGIAVKLVDDICWQVAAGQLYDGQAHLGVVCGLQYVCSVDRGDVPGIELLAAPVMAGARYEGKPIYYSEVVVRADSRARSLLDLRGCTWGYNEPTSHSGFALTRYWLAKQGESAPFFGAVIGTGAHLRSLEMLLAGEIDATAIDSTVLETELRRRPSLSRSLRLVETLGPSPIPPLVILRAVPPSQRATLAAAVLSMHLNDRGAQILADAAIARFARVSDADYNPIRTMARLASQVAPWPEPDPATSALSL